MAEQHFRFYDDPDAYTIDESGFTEGYDEVPEKEAQFRVKLPSGQIVYTNDAVHPEGALVSRKVGKSWTGFTGFNNFTDDEKAKEKEKWEKYQADRKARYMTNQKAMAEKAVAERKAKREEESSLKDASVKEYIEKYDSPQATASNLVSKAVKENIPYDEFETMIKGTAADTPKVHEEFEKQYTEEIRKRQDEEKLQAQKKAEEDKQTQKEAEEKEESLKSHEAQDEASNAVKGAKWDSNNNSIIGAITSPDSGYTGAQRVGMALKLIGQITGNAILANGMSLLGDNSYFGKIAESVNYENYKPEARKEAQKLYTEWVSNTAADIAANDKVLESLSLDKDVKDKISQLGPEIAIIASDKDLLKKRFATIGIKDPEGIEKVYAAAPGFQFSSRRSADALTAMSSAASANEARKQAETTTKRADYEYDKELWNDIGELQTKKEQLQVLKNKLHTDSLKDRIDAIAAYGAMYGQIGSSVKSAAASNSLSESSQSNWEASTSASAGWGIFSGEVSASGGHSWGSNTNTSSSTNDSETYNANYKAALDVMSKKDSDWWNDKGPNGGANVLKAAQDSIDEAINTIDEQIKYIKKKQNGVNDAVIPNGAIESVNLKNGETVAVNPDDGAVLTTNNVGPFLSFGEGEVNPFDYLGYDGEKKECAYYDTLFDDTPRHVTSFDEALELLK